MMVNQHAVAGVIDLLTDSENRQLNRLLAEGGNKGWKTFKIPKRDGSSREIAEPDKLKKAVGSTVATLIWKQIWGTTSESGFRPGRHTVAIPAILQQANNMGKTIYSIDFTDAFQAISAKQTYDLCREFLPHKVARAAVLASCLDNRLKMGANASPAIFALAMEKVKAAMLQHSEIENVVFYADDLYIILHKNSKLKLNRKTTRKLRGLAWNAIRGLKINPKKTRKLNPQGFRVLGSAVTPTTIRPSKAHRNAYRLARFTLDNKLATDPEDDFDDLANNVSGKEAWHASFPQKPLLIICESWTTKSTPTTSAGFGTLRNMK